jgi:hypothetical protein
MVRMKMSIVTVCLFVVAIWLTGPVWSAEPKMVIDLDVPPSAQVTQISITPGQMAGKPTVFVKATIKNIGDKPSQYKTKCDFGGTPYSQGFMLPKAGTPGLAVGKEGAAKFPFPSAEFPKSIKIKIEEYSLDD